MSNNNNSQKYIGIANGVVICINTYAQNVMRGVYYHGYHQGPVSFISITDMLYQLEALFDELRFPYPATNSRSFVVPHLSDTKEERKRVMTDEELLEKHGELGTFIIRVQHRQNSSWQGRITWVDENKTVYFRSIWEMMKLIDSAMESHMEENEISKPTWD